MQVTYLQKYTYELANLGYNIFVTGDAGTGKTCIVRYFADKQIESGRNVMLLAPTGIAAVNIGGTTIHREFELPIGIALDTKDNSVDFNLVNTDILIIEEISMCRIDLFDAVASKIFRANNIRKNSGKKTIQLIVIGDFFQLPPVMKKREKEILDSMYNRDIGIGFAFDSTNWKYFDFKVVILTEIVRQYNKEFIDNLNYLRVGNKSGIDYFKSKSSPNKIVGAITLCGKNSEVDEINTNELNSIASDIVEIRAEIEGEATESDSVADEILKLKTGARVMTIINDKDGLYSNGTIGTVKDIKPDEIIITLDGGIDVSVTKFKWDVYRYIITDNENSTSYQDKYLLRKEIVGSITQFPLKLAYAITIHKSQGQTYNAVNISPYCWDCGQLYTALSRVKDIGNMHLSYDIHREYAVVSLNVIKFYNEIVKVANRSIADIQAEDKSKQYIKKESEYKDDMNKIMNLLNR